MSTAMNQPSDTPRTDAAIQLYGDHWSHDRAVDPDFVRDLERELTAAIAARDSAVRESKENYDLMCEMRTIRDSAITEAQERNRLMVGIRDDLDTALAAQQQAEKERDRHRERSEAWIELWQHLKATDPGIANRASQGLACAKLSIDAAQATIAELRAQLLTAEAQADGMRSAASKARTYSQFIPFESEREAFRIELDAVLASTAASMMQERLRADSASWRRTSEKLEGEKQAAKKDASRYAFLRTFINFRRVDVMLDSDEHNTLDSAVDAAMKANP